MEITIQPVEKQELYTTYHQPMTALIKEMMIEQTQPLPAPPAEETMKTYSVPDWEDEKVWRWIALDGEAIVGYALLSQMQETNQHIGSIRVFVREAYRRQGVATQLLQAINQQLQPEMTTISFDTRDDSNTDGSNPSGSLHDWITGLGGKLVFTGRRSGRRMDRKDAAEAQQEAKKWLTYITERGYRLLDVEEGRFVETIGQDGYAAYLQMVQRIRNDMPRDEASYEDFTLSEKDHQKLYTDMQAMQRYVWTTVALDKQGIPVGLTESFIPKAERQDVEALQDDTGVLAEHRGNRLGLALKYHMLVKLLTDPRSEHIRWWTTGNAHSNAPMLRINDILKYEQLSTDNNYELSVETFGAYLANK